MSKSSTTHHHPDHGPCRVEFHHWRGCRESWSGPAEPDQFEIVGVTAGGRDLELTEELEEWAEERAWRAVA
jgi:hypothetical protein